MYIKVLCLIFIFELFFPRTWCDKVHEEDSVLCRSCGNFIVKSSGLIQEKSPSALNAFNDTLFNKENVLVQILNKDIIFTFPIITTNHSNCIGFGEWEEEELWFRGYRWKPCLCPDCGTLIGWIFEKFDPNYNQLYAKFFALILHNLVGENFLESLIVYPNIE